MQLDLNPRSNQPCNGATSNSATATTMCDSDSDCTCDSDSKATSDSKAISDRSNDSN